MRKIINIVNAPRPKGVYSQAIVANGFVFVAGQVAINPATNEYEAGDIGPQTRRVLENIRAILLSAGSSLQDIVRLGVFCADAKDLEGMEEVFGNYFPDTPPARTTVEVQLPKGIKIKIDCIAQLRQATGASR